jgi:hypothetical protein
MAMRWLLTLSVMVMGCTDGVAPPNLTSTNDDAGVGDLNDEDMPATVDAAEDLLPLPDLIPEVDGGGPDLRPSSSGCTTACDCPSGQSCTLGACTAMPMVFCCGTAGCTGAAICETNDGRISQCSAPADAGVRPDAGTTATCATVACTPGVGSSLFCRIACGNLTATCSGATGHCTP